MLNPPSSVRPSFSDLSPALAASVPPQGALAETLPRQLVGTTLSLTSGQMKLAACRLVGGLTYTSVSFFTGGTALVGGTHQLFGIYDDGLGSSSGTPLALLRSTVDDTNTAWAANSLKTLALTSTYTAVRTGLHYIAVLVAAGTPPNLVGLAGISNLNTLPPIAVGSSGAALTALPNPSGALAALGSTPYAYLL